MPQEALRAHHDKGPLVLPERSLGTKEVEVLRRGGAVGDPNVLVARKLQVTLQARRGVLRALALVAVRQEQDEPRGTAPLGLPRDDKLVDHRLRDVREVPVLGLPQDERLLRVHRVAVLEADDGDLREGAVVDRERGLRLREMLQRHVGLIGFYVVEGRVALGEGPPRRVLSGEPDRGAVLQERAERERLGVAPIYLVAVAVQLPAVLPEEPPELRVRVEALRGFQKGLVDPHEPLGRDCRLRDLDERGVGLVGDRVLLGELFVIRLFADFLHLRHDVFDHLVGLALLEDAAILQRLGPDLAHGRMVVDDLVHLRLRVCRLVALVVAEAAVADEVDHEVLGELLPVGVGHTGGRETCLRVVGVDVDDRDLVPLRQVAGVGGRAGILLLGGEADLVVGDDVDRAARAVAREPGEVQRLRDYALAGERCVAVDEDRQRGLLVALGLAGPVALLLDGPGHPLDHGVDVLEVARVWREVDEHVLVGLFLAEVVASDAEVVLDVAYPTTARAVSVRGALALVGLLELAE